MDINLIYKKKIINYVCVFEMQPGATFSTIYGTKQKIKRKINIKLNPSIYELIFYHIKHNNITAVKYLIENENIDINHLDNVDGDSFIFYAMQYNKYQIVKYLLQKNVDMFSLNPIDKTNIFGESCYFYISYKMFYLIWGSINNFELVKYELSRKNDEGISIGLMLLVHEKNYSKINFFIKKYRDDFISFIKNQIELYKREFSLNEIPKKIEYLLSDNEKTKNKLIKMLPINKLNYKKTIKL